MRTNVVCILIVLISCTVSFANNEAFFRAHKIVSSASNNESEIMKAISILSEGLQKYPENISSLTFRAQLYSSIGQFQKAYEDIQNLIKIKPKSSMYMFQKCIFEEAFNLPKENCIECYEKVIDLISAELGEKKEFDIGYICVLLLAEKQHGRELAKKYIKTLTNSTVDNFNKDLLLNFDRKKFLPHKNVHLN